MESGCGTLSQPNWAVEIFHLAMWHIYKILQPCIFTKPHNQVHKYFISSHSYWLQSAPEQLRLSVKLKGTAAIMKIKTQCSPRLGSCQELS